MLRPDDLVDLPDFSLGALTVSPSRRVVERNGESLAVEPRVMQVLVLLAQEPGAVVTRQRLFDEVWGGVPVGEDSLNRAVAGARRALALDPANLTLETIPRTGYRLHVDGEDRWGRPALSRRAVVAGAAAAGAGLGGLGLYYHDTRKDREFEASISRGKELLAYGDAAGAATPYFRRAASIRPDDAQAQGLFAYSRAYRAESVTDQDVRVALNEAERVMKAAFALDPREPNARLAQVVLQRSVLDFASTEDRLRDILKSDPRNVEVLRHLWNTLQCVGRSKDALALVERAIAVDTLAAGSHFPRAQLLWITGQAAEADRVAERALQYWPDHRFVRFARFTILAFTGRSRAALAMIEDKAKRPQAFTPEAIALWRVNLAAFDQRTPSAIARAREASLDAAKQNLQRASQAVLALAELGEVDAAFEVANGLFAVGGLAATPTEPARQPIKSTAWRFAPWLFTPPTAAMRTDPRFGAICDAAGLTEYWEKRGVRPDYQLAVA